MLPAHLYLASSYYERWGRGLEQLVLKHGLASKEEMAAGDARTTGEPLGSNLKPADVTALLTRGSYARPAPAPARFKAGDRVRARNINPPTHTRLPRYVRGHVGTVEALRGCHVFPDAIVRGEGEDPHWLYTVVFDGRDLWGEGSDPSLKVSVEAWEPYLSRMSGVTPAATRLAMNAVRGIPRDRDGPVFREPWEAQAFAMAVTLQVRGLFTWSEWAAALGEEIKRAPGGRRSRHRRDLLQALARDARADGGAERRHRSGDAGPLSGDAWDRAADRTPHGTPIELQVEDFAD